MTESIHAQARDSIEICIARVGCDVYALGLNDRPYRKPFVSREDRILFAFSKILHGVDQRWIMEKFESS
jgi:hypothetical protein